LSEFGKLHSDRKPTVKKFVGSKTSI
jgi:hypothetical protein